MKTNKVLPKITIITPSFNQGRFIKQTIESVLSQNYPNLEYLIFDSCSTDNTIEILKSFGKKIQWVSEKDEGQTNAINKGLKQAKGDIVAFINSDDYYLPNTFYKIVEFFNKNPNKKWVTGDYLIVNSNGKKIQNYVRFYKKLYWIIPKSIGLRITNYINQPSTFWRKKLTDELGFLDESLNYSMDYEYWLRFINKYPLSIINECFSAFRIHNESKSGIDYVKQLEEEFIILNKYKNNLLLSKIHWIHTIIVRLIYNIIKKNI